MSGKWKKIIWLICMLQLCVIHGGYIADLVIYKQHGQIAFFMTGTILMALFQYGGYRHFMKSCVQNIERLENQEIRSVFSKANQKAENAEGGEHRIYVNPYIRIPFVMGFFKQSVVIPASCMQEEKENLFLAFLHECFHMKRHDTLYKYIMLAANCFLWFHPLAYFFRYISYRDIEIACDEAVVCGMEQEERYRYGAFLLHTAGNTPGKKKEKGAAYSAYWNDSHSILKCRIQAVMDEKRNWDLLARAAVIFLGIEVCLLAGFSAKNLYREYEEAHKPVNEFEDAATPPLYTAEAVQNMVKLQPAGRDDYSVEQFAYYDSLYPEKEMTEIAYTPKSPWQFILKRPAHYKDAMLAAIQRFWYYMEDQTAFSSADYALYPELTHFETVYSELLAGDIKNAVWGIIWKVYEPDYTHLNTYNQGYAKVLEGGGDYVYLTTAVQVKMVEPYVFLAEGFADLEKVIDAFKSAYPQEDFSYFPQLEAASGNEDIYDVIAEGENLYLQDTEGKRIEIPIEKEYLKDPGDPLTGAGNGMRKESYQCDNKKVIFAYAPSGQALQVLIYQKNAWYNGKVSYDYPYGISKIYVDFPENEKTGYIFGVSERVVFQEACVLYKTENGGADWEKVEMSQNAAQHSLTMDFDFLTDTIGYMAIYSSWGSAPDLLRTEDGGENWEPVVFDKVLQDYSQAYAPVMQNGRLFTTIGMEGYSKGKGEKALYESTDQGKTWCYQKQVISP